MEVAILYSGGKDSTYAIEYAMSRGWDIKYLLSVKPTRKDCYLFHFATVEFTKELSKVLDIKHIYTTCDIENPEKEALIVKDIVSKNKVDALILGGVGLQETQIRSLQKALVPLGIEVFAAHAGDDEEAVLKDILKKGYKILITQVASDGLISWLGREINFDSFEDLKRDSIKYGFNLLGEGGYYDSLVYDGPIFKKRLEILHSEKIIEGKYNGYLKINKFRIVNKPFKMISFSN